MRALIGLDVGTSAVKALAIGEDGAILARSEVAYPLSTPRPGWSGAGPRGLVARDRAGARGAGRRRPGRHRAQRADARARRARRATTGSIRPAILWNDGRTAAECAEIEERVGLDTLIALHREPRADRVHRAEAAVAARATSRSTTRGSRGSCCRRTTCGCGSAASTRSTWPTPRARCCSTSPGRRWSDEVLAALELDPRVAAAPARVARGLGHRRPAACPVAAGAGDQAAGALGVGVDRPGPALDRARHERRRVRRAPRVRGRRARARARLLPRGPRRLARDGRDAVRSRLAAAGCATSPRPAPASTSSSRRRRRGSPGWRA